MLESLLSGGLVGLIGSLGSNILSYFKSKQEHKQFVEFRKLDIVAAGKDHSYAMEQIKAEAEYRTQQLMIEAERDLSVSEYSALEASYKSDTAYDGDSRLLIIAEFLRRITRPLLTFVLVFLTSAIYFTSQGDQQELIARAVVALTATALSWWFSDRQIAKQISGKLL
jgi:lipopolysaccharide export LptBFGC system permease protein LptF